MHGERIQLYDATEPIVCTLDGDRRAERGAQLVELRSSLLGVARTGHGLLLRFPERDDLEAELRRFAADEHDCCRFWGFAVERAAVGRAAADSSADAHAADAHAAAELLLRWDGPPAADELLDQLLTWLRGDDPGAALAGLL